MSEYKPKIGDRVRVSREGVVVDTFNNGETVDVDGLRYDLAYGHTFELLATPEPDHNCLLIDRDGDVWRFQAGAWLCLGDGTARDWANIATRYNPFRAFSETEAPS